MFLSLGDVVGFRKIEGDCNTPNAGTVSRTKNVKGGIFSEAILKSRWLLMA